MQLLSKMSLIVAILLGVAGRSYAKPKPILPAVALEHFTTHEKLSLVAEPNPDPLRVNAFAELMRCHHTGKKHPMDSRLIGILQQTAHHFGGSKVWVVAGYRAPEIARKKGNPRSPHQRGVAVDFYIEGVSNERVRDYLLGQYHRIGVGYYPRSGFVHVDVGRTHVKNAFWVDASRPGQRSRYVAPSRFATRSQAKRKPPGRPVKGSDVG